MAHAVNERIERFLENFGKAPDEPPPPLIPQRWRMTVFVSAVVIGGVLLALFLGLVVVPAIQRQSANPGSTTTTPPAATAPKPPT
jgi:hypothetical protein